LIDCVVFALSGLGGANDVSRVKRGRWNKKVRETLFWRLLLLQRKPKPGCTKSFTRPHCSRGLGI